MKMKTSDEWFREIELPKGTILLDPDGWDRANFKYSWGEEKIDATEFMTRMLESTCCCDTIEAALKVYRGA